MTPLRIRTYGLSDIDFSSLKSMLNLANTMLNHEWRLTSDDEADLYIYSLESEQGKTAWQHHRKGCSAILSSQHATIENADIILKKPLRTKNFSAALNNIEKIIQQANKDAPNDPIKPTPAKKNFSATASAKKKPSLFAAISKHFATKSQPVADLPELHLSLPKTNDIQPDSILDPELLKQWLNDLPENDNDKIITAILGHVVPLNRSKLTIPNRLNLLEVYRQPIHKLVFNRDLTAINRERHSPAEFLRSVKAINLLLEELAIGYKIIIEQSYQQGHRPNTHDIYLIAINRATELLALSIVHAYRYYYSAPVHSLNELHQLYLYSESAGTLHKRVTNKDISLVHSFHMFYCQIMLTGIADPYSLAKYDVFRLFNVMAKMAEKVTIDTVNAKQITASSGFLMANNFLINCDADYLPVALIKTTTEKRSHQHARIFNTEGVLTTIEQTIKNAANMNQDKYDLDVRLLKKIVPQLSASYERKFQRLPSIKPRVADIANGVPAIYEALQNDDKPHSPSEWHIINQGDQGMMLRRENNALIRININELVGIFEHDVTPQLASIRWLHFDNDLVLIGLQLHSGLPTAVTFTPNGEAEILHGLLLPEVIDIKQPMSLFVSTGIYSPNRIFRLKNGDQTSIIVADSLIDNAFNYEQFGFKTKAGS